MPSRSFGKVVFSVTAFLVWLGHFLFIYVFTALACEHGSAQREVLGLNILHLALSVATAVAFAALILVALAVNRTARATATHPKNTSVFLRWTALSGCALAAIAIAWNALPVAVVEVACWA